MTESSTPQSTATWSTRFAPEGFRRSGNRATHHLVTTTQGDSPRPCLPPRRRRYTARNRREMALLYGRQERTGTAVVAATAGPRRLLTATSRGHDATESRVFDESSRQTGPVDRPEDPERARPERTRHLPHRRFD